MTSPIALGRSSPCSCRLEVTPQSVHNWIARYRQGGLPALADRSHRPRSCPHQIPPELEAGICELRREHPGGVPGASSTSFGDQGWIRYRPDPPSTVPAPPRLGRAPPPAQAPGGVPPVQLWQMDVMGGVELDDGTELKIVRRGHSQAPEAVVGNRPSGCRALRGPAGGTTLCRASGDELFGPGSQTHVGPCAAWRSSGPSWLRTARPSPAPSSAVRGAATPGCRGAPVGSLTGPRPQRKTRAGVGTPWTWTSLGDGHSGGSLR